MLSGIQAAHPQYREALRFLPVATPELTEPAVLFECSVQVVASPTLTWPISVSRSPCTQDWKCQQTWGGQSCQATSPPAPALHRHLGKARPSLTNPRRQGSHVMGATQLARSILETCFLWGMKKGSMLFEATVGGELWCVSPSFHLT